MTVLVSNSRINALRSPGERPQSERCLGAHEIERLAGIRIGDTILCTNGVLWITQEGDPEDYLLKQGQRFVVNRLGLVLVQALDSACWRYLN